MPTAKSLRCSACSIFFPFFSALAQDAAAPVSSNAQQSAYRSSVAEESVRKQTDKIEAEITELVSELKLNGLDDTDLAILSDASSHLQTLSKEDMQKVVNALQTASMATQDKDRQKSLVSAYQKQQTVEIKLKSLAADLAAQQSQKEIPSKLENLIARQSANMRETGSLGSTMPDQLGGAQKSTHDVVSAEQTAIGGEIDLLGKVLAAKPDAPPIEGTPDVSKAVLEAMNGGTLKDVATSATQLTSAGPFPDAVAKQKAVRDGLTALLRTAISNIDAVSRLEDLKAQLTQILEDQKDLGAVTQQAKLDGTTLAERQARISDRTSIADALLKPINQAASGQLDLAQSAMEQSSTALGKAKNPADTAPQEQVVVDDLQKTMAMLDQQIADAQKQEALSPVDKLAALQQLQNQLDNAQKDPQKTASDLQKMQQNAAALSPQASNKIADAADEMQKPQPDQAAANQALAQASAAVQQQEKDLTKAAQDYQALANASQQLSQAQQAAAAADKSLQDNAANKNFTEAAHDLTQAQAALAQAQQAAQQVSQQSAQQPGQQASPPADKQDSPPATAQSDAQKALGQASDALKEATNQAVQAQGQNAQGQDQKAMAAMQKAQAGLAQAMAQAQQQSQQGQGQGKGQGQMQAQSKPGQGPGQPQPGQKNNSPSSQALATDAPDSESGLLAGHGGDGVGQVVGGLKSRDRDAITQYQAEKAPPEYAPMVQQYLKNLADSSEAESR
jgi:trimeric autotransporter adhesin